MRLTEQQSHVEKSILFDRSIVIIPPFSGLVREKYCRAGCFLPYSCCSMLIVIKGIVHPKADKSKSNSNVRKYKIPEAVFGAKWCNNHHVFTLNVCCVFAASRQVIAKWNIPSGTNVHIKMTVSERNLICCFGQRFRMFRADAEGFLQGQAFSLLDTFSLFKNPKNPNGVKKKKT